MIGMAGSVETSDGGAIKSEIVAVIIYWGIYAGGVDWQVKMMHCALCTTN